MIQDWIVVNSEDQVYECTRCKVIQSFPAFPIEIMAFIRDMEAFGKIHKNCKPLPGSSQD